MLQLLIAVIADLIDRVRFVEVVPSARARLVVVFILAIHSLCNRGSRLFVVPVSHAM